MSYLMKRGTPLTEVNQTISSPPSLFGTYEHLNTIDIGGVHLNSPTALAPMEGVTDRAFRALICGVGGCGLTVTEFVSSESLKRKDPKAWRHAELDPKEHPVSIQIYGRDPQAMAEAARQCEGLGADIIDLNLGCPSKQVTGGCSGSALMKEPDRAIAIFKAVKAAITVPLTVKMRLGWDHDQLNAADLAYAAQEEGAGMIAVHGRTRMQMYRGSADWQAVQSVTNRVQVPVLINGDILNADGALKALSESGAQGVMIGRGAVRDPWVFQRVNAALLGHPFTEPPLSERLNSLKQYFDYLTQGVNSEKYACGRIKKVIGLFTRGLLYGEELRDLIFHLHELTSIYEATEAYFERLRREGINEFGQLYNTNPRSVQLDERAERYAVYDLS
jgi:tRNA-dihydrouridine synthase B